MENRKLDLAYCLCERKMVADDTKAHNATKYIPGLNIATYPVTRIGKRFVALYVRSAGPER